MRAIGWFVVLAALGGCHKKPVPSAVIAAPIAADASAPLRDAEAAVSIMIYDEQAPTAPPGPAFVALVATQGHFQVRLEPAPVEARPYVLYGDLVSPPPWVPSAEMIAEFSRGLEGSQIAAAAASTSAVALSFAAKGDDALTDLRRAYEIAGKLAVRTGASTIWCDRSAMLYSVDAWVIRLRRSLRSRRPTLTGAQAGAGVTAPALDSA
jgi:hypothetical protein